VNSIVGAVYDAEGSLVRKLRDNEIVDQSATGSSMYADDRVKVIELNNPAYPYTVEFEYEIEYKFLFYIPTWYVLPGERTSVEHSRFTVVFPKVLQPRYKIYNSNQDVLSGDVRDDRKSWIWEHKNQPAMEAEPFAPPWHRTTPV